jgi:hypothetical protein
MLIRLDTLFYSDNSKGLYNDNNTGRKLFSRKKLIHKKTKFQLVVIFFKRLFYEKGVGG